MRLTTASVLAGFAVQQSLATSFMDWTKSSPFSCPDNTDNKCQPKESSGWNFNDLQVGNFNSYSSFSFDGFSCSGSFGKRDALGRRTSGGKAITGSLSKSGGPSFSCGSSESFSPKTYQVSVSRDADVEFQYTMEDGSTCSHVSSCKAGGSTVTNSQCGGAKNVTFRLPDHEQDGCDIGIHGIDFDCSPPKGPPVLPSSTYSTPKGTSTPKNSSRSPLSSRPAVSFSYPSPPYGSSPASPSTPGAPSIPVLSSPPEISSVRASKTPAGPEGSGSPSSEHTPMPTSDCPDVLPKCLNTWLHVTSCIDNSDSSCFCKHPEFVGEVYDCISAWGYGKDIQAAITYLIGLCATFIPENPGIITNCPSSIPITPVSATPTPAHQSSSAAVTVTTEVVYTTLTTCPVGQTVTQGSSTIVLTTPSVSTVYTTSTITTCDVCTGHTGAPPPLTTPPPAIVPYTTVTVQQTITVPCTYSTGTSAGLTIPSSSTATTISTIVTVPNVQFTTCSIAGSTSGVMLVPPPTPAVQQSQGLPAISTARPTLATSAYPVGNISATSTPIQFQGAAHQASGSSVAGLMAILAAIAYVI